MTQRSSQTHKADNLDATVIRRRETCAKYEKSEKGKARKVANRKRKFTSPQQTHFGVTVRPGPKYGLNISRKRNKTSYLQ
jgi:hypothetical protein